MNIKTFINNHFNSLEHILREHNQPTRVYKESVLFQTFGSNEGGPLYEIYLDKLDLIIEIKIHQLNYKTTIYK